MRNFFLFTITFLLSLPGFAQKFTSSRQQLNTVYTNEYLPFHPGSTAKTTAIGDTLILSNIPVADSVRYIYTEGTNDSNGYLTGTDSSNDVAFAERYDYNGADSSMVLIGVFAEFGGKVNPASSQTINFNVWDLTAPIVITSSLTYSGFPNNILDTLNVPVTQLGIGITSDTLKAFLFPTSTGILPGSFFVGYSINYIFSTLNGDTIGLASSANGTRTSPITISSVNIDALGDTSYDTVINVQNATMQSDYNWYDNYTQDDSISNDLAIFPIVVIGSPTGIKGITKNNLTFFGNFPNPAVNSTDIKFSLLEGTDVTIQIMDMAGHKLSTITAAGMSSGTHLVPVNTTDMPSGNYLYLVRTADGDGMAGKMTIIK